MNTQDSTFMQKLIFALINTLLLSERPLVLMDVWKLLLKSTLSVAGLNLYKTEMPTSSSRNHNSALYKITILRFDFKIHKTHVIFR